MTLGLPTRATAFTDSAPPSAVSPGPGKEGSPEVEGSMMDEALKE